MAKTRKAASCESCAFYNYDDDYGAYLCDVNMDEDDLVRLEYSNYTACPYYRNGDDYAIVRHQM